VPHNPRIAEIRKQNRQVLAIGITAALSVSLLIGVGKMYFVWRRWRIDYNRVKMPWDRVD
jgi:hypothetical protein